MNSKDRTKWYEYLSTLSSDEYQAKLKKDSDIKQRRIEIIETYLKTIYGNQSPFWKSLVKSDGTFDFFEAAIAGLYTPKRLLQLNLAAWTQEPVNEAPCYYIAFNMACAHSRLEKGKEALGWLDVAIEMNMDLKKEAVSDNDLSYVRENYKNEFDRLVK